MSITRRGFLKALLAVSASATVPLHAFAETVEAKEAELPATYQPIIFDLDKDNVGEWVFISIVREGNSLKTYVNEKCVDEIRGLDIETSESSILIKKKGWLRPVAGFNINELDASGDFTVEVKMIVNGDPTQTGNMGGFVDELTIYNKAFELMTYNKVTIPGLPA